MQPQDVILPPLDGISIRCVECGIGAVIKRSEGTWACRSCNATYGGVGLAPAMLRADNHVFPPKNYLQVSMKNRAGNRRWSPSLSLNLARNEKLAWLSRRLQSGSKVLVIGSRHQRRELAEALERTDSGPSYLYCTDVDVNADVDFFSDAHCLPLFDETFDFVIQTAVLEHVMYPEVVVSEIRRVLKQGGIVYSELPFMQQVHEGAYDFFRASMGGHRRLFHDFDELDAGSVAGPGTALAWAIDHFVVALTPRGVIRRICRWGTRWLFCWLKYVDLITRNSPEALDSASATYFIGTKANVPLAERDTRIIARYRSAPDVGR